MRMQSKSGASDVLVVTPLDTDVAAFSSDFVRVQGLAHSVAGQRVMGLQEGGTTVGGIVACPPPMHGMPRKLAQDCGGGGQPVCPDDIAASTLPLVLDIILASTPLSFSLVILSR